MEQHQLIQGGVEFVDGGRNRSEIKMGALSVGRWCSFVGRCSFIGQWNTAYRHTENDVRIVALGKSNPHLDILTRYLPVISPYI